MSVYMGDFLGFRLGDEHSYNLNITRVSNNNRYEDTLLPNFNDITSSVPGQNGLYYWGKQFTSKNLNIDFAYDNLRDEDIRALHRMLNYENVKPLILDEYPYKKYYVTVAAPPTLRYICFDYKEFRIYKGEGNINFIAYYPYAFGVVDPKLTPTNTTINNTGDLPGELEIIYNLSEIQGTIDLELHKNKADGLKLGELHFKNIIPLNENDSYIFINTRTQLVEGLDKDFKKTGTLYNRFIVAGDFFHPPVGTSILTGTVNFETAKYQLLYF